MFPFLSQISGSAPASNRILTMSWPPFSAAVWRAVWFIRLTLLTLQPPRTSWRTVSVCPLSTAYIKGELPHSSHLLGSAPKVSNIMTTTVWPCLQASWTTVRPRLVVAFTSHLRVWSSRRTQLLLPLLAAATRADVPYLSRIFTYKNMEISLFVHCIMILSYGKKNVFNKYKEQLL